MTFNSLEFKQFHDFNKILELWQQVNFPPNMKLKSILKKKKLQHYSLLECLKGAT